MNKTKNPAEILENLEHYIEVGDARYIRTVCDCLGIFDWWNDSFSISQMTQMRSFLKKAIALGFTGCASFKVGAKGCANGMWAFKEQVREDGYDPDGDRMYHSFVCGDNYYDAKINGVWFSEVTDKRFNTVKFADIKKYIEENK